MIRMVRSLMKIWLVTYMACGCVACRSNKKSHPLEGEVAVSVPCYEIWVSYVRLPDGVGGIVI